MRGSVSRGRRLGRRRRVHPLPVADDAHRRVLGEQAVQRGRAGARQAEHHQRGDDLLLVDLRVTRVPVLDPEAVAEQHHRLPVEHRPAGRVQPRVAIGRLHEAFEPLAKRLLAEVVESGRGFCRLQQIGNPAHDLQSSRRALSALEMLASLSCDTAARAGPRLITKGQRHGRDGARGCAQRYDRGGALDRGGGGRRDRLARTRNSPGARQRAADGRGASSSTPMGSVCPREPPPPWSAPTASWWTAAPY